MMVFFGWLRPGFPRLGIANHLLENAKQEMHK
jgi:hypothetical protein